ncbi:hypothetical protein ACQ4PT_002630 [Festuca glaucescens]
MAGRAADQGGHKAGKEPALEETIDEKIGRLKLTEAESKKLVIDDREEGSTPSWSLAGKVLSRKVFHINTISAILRPAWGNPKGLLFRDGGTNMFVAKFVTERDRDRVWEGSPWTVSKQACILVNFVDCQRPAEIRFDKLLIWVRVLNLPFNLLNSTWGARIANEISDDVVRVDVNKQGLTSGGFLRARVWIKVDVPLRRCIAIDSSRRESCDWYELEYEDLPYFCFACGLIGHADIFCPNLGERDEQGRWPYSPSLRAPDDVKTKRQFTSTWNNNMGSRDSRSTGNAEHGTHVPPPNQGVQGGRGDGSGRGRGGGRNRGGPVNMQVYRRLEMQPTGTVNGGGMDVDGQLVVFDPNAAGAKRD